MKLHLDEGQYIDTDLPIDLSYPISNTDQNNNAWYCESPTIEPVRTEAFLGSVAEGGNVNFRNIFFNPHGNGTHTECVGHIAEEVYSLHERLRRYFFMAELISVTPSQRSDYPEDDLVIDADMLKKASSEEAEALVIRTLPNTGKKGVDYSNSNPPYLTLEAMKWIVDKGYRHLLIDTPSVDREFDEGQLAAHHLFWNYPQEQNSEKTITELIFVPDHVKDGRYVLNLMVAPFHNDASPSKPVLYALNQD